jgi:predicted ATP-binding protein involved in virulence
MAAITEIHQTVFDFLQEKYPELRFSLRQVNRYDRLEQGYWFHGNENYMIVSFWDGLDWRNKTPNIFFFIGADGKTRLELVDTDGGDKATFFENISPSLKSVRQGKRFIWWKYYNNYENDYLSSLESFIKNDKQLIDSFIKISSKKQEDSLFPLIKEDEFNAKRARVLELRNKHTKAKITPLSIKRLELKNIGHFEQLDIDLSNRVICFIGENGTGKSTILRAILLGLMGINDETQLIDPENKEIQRLLRIEKEENGLSKFASQGLIRLHYFDKDKNDTYFDEPSKSNSVDEKGHIITEGIRIYSDKDSNLSATNGDYFKNVVVALSQVRSISDGKSQAVDFDIKRPHISDTLSLLYDLADDSFYKFVKWIQDTADSSASKSFDERQKDLLVIQQVFYIIQQITGSKIFKLVEFAPSQKEIFIKTDDAPNGVPIRLMSQGFMNVIGWVGYFIKRIYEVTPEGEDFTKTRAILLIDEIDTYLHPKWQRTILNVLATTFTETYFIITTHSPLVISNLTPNIDAKIYTVAKKIKGEMIVFEELDFNPYGATANRILENLMGTQERPKLVADKFSAFDEAIKTNDFEHADSIAIELEEMIDPRDPEILRRKTQIDARKKLIALKNK